METTSADVNRLTNFAGRTAGGLGTTEGARAEVAADLAGVIANCANPVEVPAVAALSTLLATMGDDNVFVTAIRDELLRADTTVGGVATVSDLAVTDALRAAGVAEPAAAIEVDPVTLTGIQPTSGYVDDPICAGQRESAWKRRPARRGPQRPGLSG